MLSRADVAESRMTAPSWASTALTVKDGWIVRRSYVDGHLVTATRVAPATAENLRIMGMDRR